MRDTLRSAALGVACWVLAGCGGAFFASHEAALPADATFATAQPEAGALARYQRAAAWSEDVGGLALVIIQDGAIVFESYRNGHAVDKPAHLFSGTKSFACPLALLAEEAGMELDAPTGLEAWDADPVRRRITPRQLLNLTSGLEDDFRRLTWDGLRSEQRIQDKTAIALSLPTWTEPGARFHYHGTSFFAFAEAARIRLGRDPLEALTERVFAPLGMRFSGWLRDPSGAPFFAYGAWTTAREWARFGQLIVNDGAWEGQAIFPPGALARCFQGSDAMPAYGLAFWLNAPVTAAQREGLPPAVASGGDGPLLSPHAPGDLVAAAGHKDQRLYVSPSQRLVIVRLGEGDSDFNDADLLGLLFAGVEP